MVDALPARQRATRPLAAAGLVLVAALSRLIPHPFNFTPIGAMALFGGAAFESTTAALALPVAALLLSDLALTAVHERAPDVTTLVVYACFAATTLLGRRLRRRPNVTAIAAMSLLSAILFFAITNLAVWALGHLYPPSPAGLASCYLAGLPFFANSLAGDAAYALLLFGGFELLRRRTTSLRRPRPMVAPAIPARRRDR